MLSYCLNGVICVIEFYMLKHLVNPLMRIYKDDRLIANYWHDYRGDEHGIEFLNGKKESWPVGRMIDFLERGGPKPLILSAKAMVYLNEQTD